MSKSNKVKEQQEQAETEDQQNQSQIKEALNMYNNLWDQSPIIQRMKAASKAEALQDGIINVVTARFPFLVDLARKKVVQINDPEKLNSLLVQISTAPDEVSARMLLAPTVA